MIRIDIETLPPEEFNNIMYIFENTSSMNMKISMIQNNHGRDLTFINSIRNDYYDTERSKPVLLSPKQRLWLEFIRYRIDRGAYAHPNINLLIDPPKTLLEEFGDIAYNSFLDEDESEGKM